MSSKRRHDSTVKLSSNIKQEECSDDAASVCRVCLRGDGTNLSLQEITQDMKTYFQSVLKQKILRKDPHQQVCAICLTLLEIFAAFKDVALRANSLLLEKKKLMRLDADEEWPLLAPPLTRCKDLVLAHLDSLADPSAEAVEPKQEIEPEVRPKRGRRKKEAALSSETAVKVEPVVAIEPLKLESDDISESDKDDDDNDGDFKPASENEEPASDSSDSIEGEDDEDFKPSGSKIKKKGKTDRAPRKPRPFKLEYKSRSLLCPLCGITVCNETAEGHLNKHRGVKPYRCAEPGCTLEFYGDAQRKRHVHRMHNKAGPKSNECPICKKTIKGDKGVLNEHVRNIHNTKEKKFVCAVCGKAFALNQYLKQHGMVHSEEFPHSCSYCGKRFNNKWSMRTHEKLHQKGSLAVQPAEFSSDPAQNTGSEWANVDNGQQLAAFAME